MNAGLGNLDTLKRHLLPESMVAQTNFDAKIANVGKGVAGLIEKHCNRQLARVVGDKAEFTADRAAFWLPRYPVEVITTVEQKDEESAGYVALPDAVQNSNLKTGQIWFAAQLGEWWSWMRITYTGGFFWEQLEPADVGYPTAQPGGSTALPDDIKLAWLLQCGRVWELIDKLGTNISPDKQVQFVAQTLSALELVPEVKQILNAHVRYQIS